MSQIQTQDMQVYEFTTSDDGGRRGGAKYHVYGNDIVFRQDFKTGFGPGTRDIMIWDGAGRWAKMNFVSCRCPLLCHWPGDTSDTQVKITSRKCDGAAASSEPHYIVEFQPIAAAAAAVTTRFFRTVDDQGRQGGTKYRVIGRDVTFEQDLTPGSGDITIRNGDGRLATMTFIRCKCFKLCHVPGRPEDNEVKNRVKITLTPREADAQVTVEFLPTITETSVSAN